FVFQRKHPNTIFLANTTQSADQFSVLTHEAIHTIEGTPFHQALRDVVWATRTPDYKRLAITRHGNLPHDALLNEVVADIAGTELHKPEVWTKVFHELSSRVGEERAKAETLGFIDTIKDLIA